MPKVEEEINHELANDINKNQWPGIDSRYRLIVIAALRSKQLKKGASPRLVVDAKKKYISIAIEEVKNGKVPFKITTPIV